MPKKVLQKHIERHDNHMKIEELVLLTKTPKNKAFEFRKKCLSHHITAVLLKSAYWLVYAVLLPEGNGESNVEVVMYNP